MSTDLSDPLAQIDPQNHRIKRIVRSHAWDSSVGAEPLVQRPIRAVHARMGLSLHIILKRVHFRHKQIVLSVCASALGRVLN